MKRRGDKEAPESAVTDELERAARLRRTLSVAGELATATTLEELNTRMQGAVRSVVRADIVHIGIYDAAKKTLRFATGAADGARPVEPGSPPAQAIEKRTAVLAPLDDEAQFGWSRDSGPGAAVVYTPVVDGDRVRALLVLVRSTDQRITQEEIALIETIAAFTAPAFLRIDRVETPPPPDEDYRSIVDALDEAVFRTDDAGRWTYLSSRWRDLTGYSARESHGRIFADDLHADDRERFRDAIVPVLEGREEVCRAEVRYAIKSGETRWFEMRVRPLRNGSGDVIGTAGTLRDISERRRADEAVQMAERQLRSVSQAARDAIIGLDEHGDIIAWNRGAETLFGYRESEVRGKDLTIILPERFRKAKVAEAARSAAGDSSAGLAKPIKLHGLKSDGTEFPIELSLGAWTTPEGGTSYTAIIREIGEEVRVKTAMERSLAHARGALEAVPDALLVVGVEGRILYANHRFAEMWKVPDEMLESLDENAFLDLMASRVEDGADAAVRARGLKPDAATSDVIHLLDGRIYERRSHPHLANGEVVGRVWSFRDVTERIRQESQARQLQQIEAVGRLAGGVARHFNNVLTVLRGTTDIVMDEIDDANPVKKDIVELQKATQRGTELAMQLLAFSRQEVVQASLLDLNAVVRGLRRALQKLLHEDTDLVIHTGSTPEPVLADPDQLRQVLVSLITNSAAAITSRATVRIEVSHSDLDARHFRQHRVAPAPGSYATLIVSDTGSGMDSETLSRAFEPFFTTRPPGQGAGLGLATVYGIVKRNNGYIWAQSEPGKGTTFTIHFPSVAEPAPSKELRATGAFSIPGTETILVMDDDDSIRSLVRRILEGNGYTVLVAADDDEAYKLANEHSGKIDLLLTDTVKQGGRRLGEELRQTRSALRVMYMSGYTEDAVLQRGLIEPGSPFMQKPFTRDVLLTKVRELLDEREPAKK